MDVNGQWYYARWLGGSCRLTLCDEKTDVDKKDVTFSEGKLEIPLHYCTDGWWEGPPDSGLRICRRGRYLILRRQQGNKGRVKQFRATSSKCAAACLCYTSPFGHTKLAKDDASPPSVLVPAVEEPESLVAEEPCDDAAVIHMEAPRRSHTPPPEAPPPEPTKEHSEASREGSEDTPVYTSEGVWPEPEAEGQPEQPSTAQDPDHLISLELNHELPDTASSEKLVQHPQISPYCLGVTSRNHSAEVITNVIQLGEAPHSPGTAREVLDSLNASRDADYVDVTPDGSDFNLAIVEDLSPRSPVVPRVVAEVDDLQTTIHGLHAVPEHAELPDEALSMAPSKSDASILLGGSVIFDAASSTRLQEDVIPEKVSILHGEAVEVIGNSGSPTEPGSFESSDANASPIVEEEPEEEDPRLRPNPLMRSHKVSGSLSRDARH